MAVFMTKDRKELIVTCDCGCMNSFYISVDDSCKDINHYGFLSFMKNNFYTEYSLNPWRAFKIKLKKIWCILRGKDYFYSDTIMKKADFEEFKRYVNQF